MYYVLGTRIARNSAGTAYSPAVDMVGDNAVYATVVAVQGTGTFVVEEGNDRENWTQVTASMTGGTFNASGGTAYNVLRSTAPNITGKYVRVKYIFTSASVISSDVNTSTQA